MLNNSSALLAAVNSRETAVLGMDGITSISFSERENKFKNVWRSSTRFTMINKIFHLNK